VSAPSDDEPWQRKVDPRLRQLVAGWRAGREDGHRVLHVLVRVQGDLDSLASAGLHLGSRAGDVAIGAVALKDIPTVGSLPQVTFMEVSRPWTQDEMG
jgi:hypothetical protein